MPCKFVAELLDVMRCGRPSGLKGGRPVKDSSMLLPVKDSSMVAALSCERLQCTAGELERGAGELVFACLEESSSIVRVV